MIDGQFCCYEHPWIGNDILLYIVGATEVPNKDSLQIYGLEHLYALRINERGLFKKTITGSHTGVGRQPREFVWVPTNKFIPSIEKAAQRLVPWFRSALDPSDPLPAGFDPVYGVFIDRV